MSLQRASWGEIEWLQTDDGSPASRSMSIGIATIFPHASQKSHVHYENEQFIYIMQGAGIDIINGTASKFEKGMFYYIPPNVTHQIFNTGDIPIKHVVVTVYVAKRRTVSHELPEIEHYSECLCAAVEALRNQILGPNSPPVTIFDDMGNLVLRAEHYPDYCLTHCPIVEEPEKCVCFRKEETPSESGRITTTCPYGLAVSKTPILYNQHFLGCICSGHLFLGGQQDTQKIDMYETSTGTLLAIQTWVDNIVEGIINFCSFDSVRQNLRLKEALIEQGRNNQKNLEASLKAMQNTVTNLHINHHFLFNTLNAIAGQALLGDEVATYQAITDLAKMFRYTTSENLKIVPLREELSYLRTYLHMQQLRYGESLSAEVICPKDILDGLVPFNFLQPFVENAFTHGFTNMVDRKILKVEVSQQKERLLFTINNNGTPIDAVTINRILTGMSSGSGHGLSLVYTKLQSTYGDDFSISITSDAQNGTTVSIALSFLLGDPQGGERT